MARSRIAIGLLGACLVGVVSCGGEEDGATPDSSPTVICDNTYALCAAAECFVYNTVAYCKCTKLEGKSISATFEYTDATGGPQDICDLNAQGVAQDAYMASTFSLPDSVLVGGTQAVYTCPSDSTGAYAQCDGGICFDSSTGSTFPGFDSPVGEGEIMCSCPITSASAASNPLGYQFMGPYPCEPSVFDACGNSTNTNTGTNIPVGSPSGVPRLLSIALTGENPDINECFQTPVLP